MKRQRKIDRRTLTCKCAFIALFRFDPFSYRNKKGEPDSSSPSFSAIREKEFLNQTERGFLFSIRDFRFGLDMNHFIRNDFENRLTFGNDLSVAVV